jgi:hypothetical protein
MKTFSQFVAEAKITDKKHIENYTDLSRPLSRILYQHHNEGKEPPRQIEHEGQHFDLDALDRITHKSKLSKNTEVFTGIRHDPRQSMNGEGHLHLPAYTSTSDSYSVGKKFATKQARRKDDHGSGTLADGHILHIHLTKGQHAVSLASKSTYGDESERLLPRNTVLKVHPEPDTRTDSDGRKIHVWKSHVVSQG